MTQRLTLAAALAAGIVGLAPAAQAHHSFAMFDFTKQVTVKGTVQELQWKNPHVVLYVEENAKPGAKPRIWSLELTSPGNLQRNGWTKRTFNPGQKVEVTLNPLRSGLTGGAFSKAVILDTGQVITSNLRAAGAGAAAPATK
jgi:hypothetical protein